MNAMGKRREIPNFIHLFPQNYDTYIEPFLGGGAVYFQQEPERAIVNDINTPLINFYTQLAIQYEQVMSELRELQDVYEHNSSLYREQKKYSEKQRVPDENEKLYYEMRDMYNGITPTKYLDATLYYFINKTAYSGMIRVNSRGEFNVPYGRYKHFNVENIGESHRELLNRTQILNTDFEDVFELAKPDDFMFLDPPYDRVFHQYGNLSDDFGENEHRRLQQAFRNLSCRALMVISKTPLTMELYGTDIVAEYPVKYSVSMKNRLSGNALHIVAANY